MDINNFGVFYTRIYYEILPGCGLDNNTRCLDHDLGMNAQPKDFCHTSASPKISTVNSDRYLFMLEKMLWSTVNPDPS